MSKNSYNSRRRQADKQLGNRQKNRRTDAVHLNNKSFSARWQVERRARTGTVTGLGSDSGTGSGPCSEQVENKSEWQKVRALRKVAGKGDPQKGQVKSLIDGNFRWVCFSLIKKRLDRGNNMLFQNYLLGNFIKKIFFIYQNRRIIFWKLYLNFQEIKTLKKCYIRCKKKSKH